MLLPGYRLAVRNCTWESRFWLGLLRGLERTRSNREEIVGNVGVVSWVGVLVSLVNCKGVGWSGSVI